MKKNPPKTLTDEERWSMFNKASKDTAEKSSGESLACEFDFVEPWSIIHYGMHHGKMLYLVKKDSNCYIVKADDVPAAFSNKERHKTVYSHYLEAKAIVNRTL